MTDPTREAAIDQLNSFLRGELSAVETYDQVLRKAEDRHVQAVLQGNRGSHASRAQWLGTEILRLGGKPAESSGAWGALARAVEAGAKVFGVSAAVSVLEEGEDRGLDDYRDLDAVPIDVREFVSSRLLPEQRRTHDAISSLKRAM